jgi:hypothetical protein
VGFSAPEAGRRAPAPEAGDVQSRRAMTTTTSPSAFGRSAAAFWLASLAGFAAHGWVLAVGAAGALAEGGAPGRAETAGAALALALAEAVVLGVPAALAFAAALPRSRRGAWAAALRPALVVGAALGASLAAWGWACADAGWAHGPALHVALGAATAAAGAVTAVVAAPSRA